MEKVTLYKTGEFFGNVIKLEITMESLSREDYAQYKEPLTVVGTPKRKRTKYKYRSPGYKPFFIVAKGWNLPEPYSMFGKETKEDMGDGFVMTRSQSRYSSCDDRYVTDFMSQHYSKLEVIAESVHEDYKKAA